VVWEVIAAPQKSLLGTVRNLSPDEAHDALLRIVAIIEDPNTVSDIPVYVRAGLKEGLTAIAADKLPTDELASKLIGAFRMIGDTCAASDDDIISGSLLGLYEALRSENDLT